MDDWLAKMRAADPAQKAFAAGVLVLTACYVIVFMLSAAGRTTLISSLIDALINVGALSIWSLAAWWLNLRVLFVLRWFWQGLVQPITAFLFAFCWYFSVTVLLGWRVGDFTGSFSVEPFSSVAFYWQAFQGITVYALVVALAAIQLLWQRLEAQPVSDRQRPQRLLVRVEDEFVTVQVDDIIAIERAGDYAQLVTSKQRYLTRKSLAELQRQLPAEQFIRVHRAHLINLNALESIEAIGSGRMRAHLAGGLSVATSRNGAQLLRKQAG